MRRSRKVAAGVVGVVFIAVPIAAIHAGVRFNASVSMPRGLWVETAKRPVTRGDIVVACLPDGDVQRRYLGPGGCPDGRREPVLKPVAAVAGDVVAVDDAGVTVNGATLPNTAPMDRDGAGRVLVHQAGTFIVPDGAVWLIVQRRDSYDSRYFGAVRVDQIEAVAAPLLVWR